MIERLRQENSDPDYERLKKLEQITSEITHDLNNLLSVILGRVDMLQKRTDNQELVKLELTKIEASASRAIDMITKLQSLIKDKEHEEFTSVNTEEAE
jgi:signal transduction histidine kinase